MATFAVSVEDKARLLPPPLRQITPRHERGLAALLVSGLTLLAFATHGYHPFAEDGGLYQAGIQRLLDPSLFPHNASFVLEPTRHSLFAPAVAAMVRSTHLSLPFTLLILHLASIWTTLFAAWVLSTRCWPALTARCGAVVLLACWLSLPVAGTALAIMDPYLTARSISTPCTLLALAAAFGATDSSVALSACRRNVLLWLASIILATAMHPLMGAYAFGSTLIVAALRSPSLRHRIISALALSALAVSIAACIQLTAPAETSEYQRVALTRTYWFPAEWSWYEQIGLAAPLVILAIFALNSNRNSGNGTLQPSRTLAQMAIAAGVTAWFTAVLFCHASIATHLVARLQPLRVFHIVYLVMILMLGATLGELVLRHRPWRWGATILILAGTMLATSRASFPVSPQLELPWVRSTNPWVQAFVWIRNNTPQNALFGLDADYINSPGEEAQCFRAIARRSSLPDYSKDGGEASIAPDLTPAWSTGQQAQQRLSAQTTTDSARLASLGPLGVTWLVLDAQAPTRLECPYSNSSVKVCRLL